MFIITHCQVALHMLHMLLDELLIGLDMLTNPFVFQFSFGCVLFLWYSEAVAVWPIFKLYSYSRDIVFLVEKKQEKQILGWGSCVDSFFIKCVIFKKISVPITVIINFTKTLMCWFSFFSWFKRQHGACGVLVKAQEL